MLQCRTGFIAARECVKLLREFHTLQDRIYVLEHIALVAASSKIYLRNCVNARILLKHARAQHKVVYYAVRYMNAFIIWRDTTWTQHISYESIYLNINALWLTNYIHHTHIARHDIVKLAKCWEIRIFTRWWWYVHCTYWNNLTIMLINLMSFFFSCSELFN